MATVEISKKDLEKQVGRKLDLKQLERDFFDIKCEIDKTENDSIFVEVEFDRPDMLSTAGLARQLRGYYGIETGLKKYHISEPKLRVKVSGEMKKYRPYSAYAVVRNVKFTEDLVKQFIQLQDKLDAVYGQGRNLAAMGTYDLSKINGDIEYKAMKPEEIKYTPLGAGKEMTAKQILEEHPKGIEHRHVLEHLDKYPVLIDSRNVFLALIPIINNEINKVTEQTTDMFIDSTGYNEHTVNKILATLATMLAEAGAQIEAVEIIRDSDVYSTPNLQYKEIIIDPAKVKRILGINMTSDEIITLLKRQRYNAAVEHGKIKATAPCYRFDVMHEVDVIEDIADAYGLNNMKPVLPNVATIGSIAPINKKSNKARETMMGMGFQEFASFIMGKKESLEKFGKPAEIENPVTEEYNALRSTLVPKVIEFFAANTHYELPQKVFECGETLEVTNKGEEKTRTVKRICAGIISNNTGFTEIKSVCEALLRSMKVKYELKEKEESAFIHGRCAAIHDTEKKKDVGLLGEISPEILTSFGLENPVTVFEIELGKIE